MAATNADIVRRWLERVLAHSGMKPTPFAKKVGIAPSTILRALDPTTGTVLDLTTIAKIVTTFAVAPPVLGQSAAVAGFAEADLAPFVDDADATALPANQYRKRVNTRALELVGYLPGDLVTFDMAAIPQPGDVVEAQVYAPNSTSAETRLRLYSPPYLLPRAVDPAVNPEPLYVDGQRVRIAAVAIKVERWPRRN